VGSFSTASVPKGLRFILIATVAVWIVQCIPGIGAYLTNSCALVPRNAVGHLELWRFFTYMFLHDPRGPMHILFNMLALWMFGGEIEELWGTKRFIGFYVLSGAGSGLFSVMAWHSSVIGASGAVLALLTVYACLFPGRTVLMFFLFPVPVRMAVVIIGAVSLWGAWSGAGDIAYLTHLGGIAIGFLYVKYAAPLDAWAKGLVARPRGGSNVFEFRKKADMPSSRNSPEDVDLILKKISEKGMASLTKKEMEALEKASKGRKKE
jgi:membrane associated rhomboid family serine protease